jgi:glycosyltransferase involved in cell wall biosynthesis
MDPFVSVVICAYRVTDYIAEALDSALAQTIREIEIVVVNDGCPDTVNLEKVLAPYLAKNQIRYIKQENRGVAAARNTGIKAAQAPLVAMLDADDRLRSNSIEILLNIMRARPNTAMVYGDGMFFGGTHLDGQVVMKSFPSRSGRVSYADMITRQAHPTAGVMFRRERVVEVGFYDESLRKAEDFDLALRLARSGAAVESTGEIVYDYRLRPESLSHSGDDIQRWRIRVLEKQRNDPGLNSAEQTMLAAELRYQNAGLALEESKRALLCGDYALARSRFREATRERGSPRLALVSLLLLVMPWVLRQFALFREKSSQRRSGAAT